MMYYLMISFSNGKVRQWVFATEWEVRACVNAMKLLHDNFVWGYCW